jgi:hypothetical protein
MSPSADRTGARPRRHRPLDYTADTYYYLDFERGEPLRWNVELKDGALVGTFSAQHHRPHKWIYDRVGAISLTKAKLEPPQKRPVGYGRSNG